MSRKERKTEHAGPKKGVGAFYGRKREAKRVSNRKRRQRDQQETRDGQLCPADAQTGRQSTRIPMTGPSPTPRPLGITLLAAFFAFGTSMCLLTIFLLARPSSPLSVLWRLNPGARTSFEGLGTWAFLLMLGVGGACAAAAAGLYAGRAWGRTLAILILVTNLAGNIVNAVMRHDLRGLIGVPIAAALVAYLVSPAARAWFVAARTPGGA